VPFADGAKADTEEKAMTAEQWDSIKGMTTVTEQDIQLFDDEGEHQAA
jgi:hypothetical protein